MRMSVVTPCYNSENYIGDTVKSVLNQTSVLRGEIDLEYIIRDGGSNDRTLDVLSQFQNSSLRIVSQPDSGMYDALATGLQEATGDIVAYINAGDYYHGSAFDVVRQIFDRGDVKWLTGFNTFCNEDSATISVNLPFKYRTDLLRKGAYGRVLPYVQQESTFWARELHETLDFQYLSRLRLAGDHYMWTRFAGAAKLKIVQAHLGTFKNHPGQLSSATEKYLEEAAGHSARLNVVETAQALSDKAFWYSPNKLKRRLNSNGIFYFDTSCQRWQY